MIFRSAGEAFFCDSLVPYPGEGREQSSHGEPQLVPLNCLYMLTDNLSGCSPGIECSLRVPSPPQVMMLVVMFEC